MTVCPLCRTDFEEGAACRSCGLVSRCALVRCPRCGYEFVEKSRVIDFIRRLARRRMKGKKK